MSQISDAPRARTPLSLPELTVMLASLIATIAFSIDGMLPALPDIAAELSPDAVNRAQLVLTSFVLGMGVGTLFAGPISDALGRRKTIAGGIAIYMVGAFVAAHAQSLEALLAARVLQGIGASGPRITVMALVRDLFAGREMAKITSFIMMIFILVPAVAPSIGQLVIAFAGWRGVFWAFMVFGCVGVSWLMIRQPETLAPEDRRPLSVSKLRAAAMEVITHADVRLYIVTMTLGFGQMFGLLSTAQQLYAAHGVTDTFPMWFAIGALMAGSATIFNARYVMRLGMRKIVKGTYMIQIVVSAVMLVLVLSGLTEGARGFPFIFVYSVSVFAMAGLTFGNLNALALEHMGHIAGMAASIVAAISTVGAVVIAAPVGLSFNGTALPMVVATLICSSLAWWLIRKTQETD
ncbi:multidrug effflux MFS transporter [Thioclava sp. F36-7]|uniref:multidrug effflux MFS transporter n=1 Tax=Thioclava sp. F36-7 TaxID=1915317 RepID=UPI00099887A8|nr:multidrug effflux MFS transporter [Thioclava sp. F36-7]OOY07230.1 multidrug MFS transporter [Thioclava sp. F36-7]